jgi:hypothetical protein
MRKVFFSVAAWFCVSLYAPFASCQQSCNPSAEVKAALDSQWQGWAITKLSDLTPEDQKLWVKTHHNECPGMSSGHLTSKSIQDTAITLKRADQQAILLFTPAPDGKGKLQILNKPYTGCCSVISILPQGSYRSATSPDTVRTSLDSVIVEMTGAASQLIYFRAGAFHRLQLSD